MSETVRIGIVGTENSHVDQIIDYLNVSHPAAGARVVALAGGDTERNLQLSAVGGIRAVVDSVTDLIGSIDALIVTNRDGGLHREQAVPLLEAGVPVWVDKPLAVTVEDAEAIIEAAQRTRTPLTSYSALRWIPDTEALVERARDLGPLQSVCATGPADPASPWGGIFFYGIHPADVALRLAPGPLGPVRVESSAGTVMINFLAGETHVTLQLVKPAQDARVPFHIMVTGRTGIVASELRLDASYVAPGLETFLTMVRSGIPPVDYPDLLRPISALESARAQLG